ncbi:MAG: hypothetical protein ABSG59_00360 [Verrucomicrobiota bacterium]
MSGLAPQFGKAFEIGYNQAFVVRVLPLNPRSAGRGILIGKIKPLGLDPTIKRAESPLQIWIFALGRNQVGEERRRVQIVFGFPKRFDFRKLN